jgi:hypothetical protein
LFLNDLQSFLGKENLPGIKTISEKNEENLKLFVLLYADDNTLSFGSPHFDLLISTLESDSNHLIEWFKINKMQANPDKFQVLAVGQKTYEKRPTINIQNFELYLFGIFLCTKMPGQRAKVKITKNKSMENCKFV